MIRPAWASKPRLTDHRSQAAHTSTLPIAPPRQATLSGITHYKFCYDKLGFGNVLSFSVDQGDQMSGKPGNVREFDSCQGNVRDFTKSKGIVGEKILSGKSCLKLFIVSCLFASIQVFSMSLFCVKY